MPQKSGSRQLSKQDELLVEHARYLRSRKKKLSKKERFFRFIWNSEKQTFMGRTGSSWSKIGLFYLIFYGMLAALVAICMWAFMKTLNPREPRRLLNDSLIGTNPGLGFRPLPSGGNEESTLIWFKGSNKTSHHIWVDNLLKFLDKYYFPNKVAKGNVQVKACSYVEQPKNSEVCEVEVRKWGDCNRQQFFNYHKNSPCIFLKLNRIYGWKPEYYDDPNNLPHDMPDWLKVHIRSISNPLERKNIWLSCEGESPADREFLGPVSYYPKEGFPGYYFPYMNGEGYLSPLVAVQLERPRAGVLINVECRAWAKNIKYVRAERLGSVHFEILID